MIHRGGTSRHSETNTSDGTTVKKQAKPLCDGRSNRLTEFLRPALVEATTLTLHRKTPDSIGAQALRRIYCFVMPTSIDTLERSCDVVGHDEPGSKGCQYNARKNRKDNFKKQSSWKETNSQTYHVGSLSNLEVESNFILTL